MEQHRDFMKRFLLFWALIVIAALAIFFGGTAVASTIKVWSTGETLKASDLNSNFAHIHNNMVGGHGARLVNGDVSATAAIAHSKLATPALVPKAWATVNGVCGSSPCTITTSSNVTSIARTGAGVYTVTLAYTPANTSFHASATSHTGNTFCVTSTFATAAPHLQLNCVDAIPTATDVAFGFEVWDDN